ncbi:diacylglycerol kinase [Sphingomonas sp. LB-2]|uniref:diacylglycerol kinase n=1 Tax=Sphingomonas caeni TaxID=2984949 RepID=UPI002231D601|nr:diacylglycerol kinase [Sphingomonas caeni]MCW3849557.1 diacylglycerol kinase [Sphingomonas caeni]
MKNRSFRERIGFALAGWREAFARESSFRTQSGMAGLALAALLVLRPAPVWWALVGLTCALVLALELINSAVEAVIDLLHPGIHPSIKLTKDMLAGAVLVMSCASLVVGVAMVVENAPRLLVEIGLW